MAEDEDEDEDEIDGDDKVDMDDSDLIISLLRRGDLSDHDDGDGIDYDADVAEDEDEDEIDGDDEDDMEEISIEEAFEELSRGRARVTLDAICEWNIVKELLEEGTLTMEVLTNLAIQVSLWYCRYWVTYIHTYIHTYIRTHRYLYSYFICSVSQPVLPRNRLGLYYLLYYEGDQCYNVPFLQNSYLRNTCIHAYIHTYIHTYTTQAGGKVAQRHGKKTVTLNFNSFDKLLDLVG